MGFDLYGVKPSGCDVPMPCEDSHRDVWSEYFKLTQSLPGGYFRSNVWCWRPLWSFVTDNCADILNEKDVEYGFVNDGHLISSAKAKQLANRLKELFDNGVVKDNEKQFSKIKKDTPDEECLICDGTGTRKGWEGWQSEGEWLKYHSTLEEVKENEAYAGVLPFSIIQTSFKRANEVKGCNACKGIGTTKPFVSNYHFVPKYLKEFAEFCKNSGGFTIH